MKKQIFNYHKENLRDHEYYGFHHRHGRIHIDTKRIKKLHMDDVFPQELFSLPRNTHYFIPRHKERKEYFVNCLVDCLESLKYDWHEEYQYVISKIKTPEEVKNNSRMEMLSSTGDSDDYDEIEVASSLEGVKRYKKYNSVIRSLYLQYVQKIFVDYFRAFSHILKTSPRYANAIDLSFKDIIFFTCDCFKTPVKSNPIFKLKHYKYLNLLNKLDNFLKHNSVRSYMELACSPSEKQTSTVEFYKKYVYSEQEMKHAYETGMYAGNWIRLEDDLINDVIDNLIEFSKEYCKLVFDEDYEEAEWNSDESLLDVLIHTIYNVF